MPTLHIMRGLPACGKSTAARQLIKTSGNAVRVNKDLLRTMLHFGKWTGPNEKLTHAASRALVKELLTRTSVIVDDTNLHPAIMQGWKDLGRETGSHVLIHDMTDVTVKQCIQQNDGRLSSERNGVDRFVIANTALRYGLHTFAHDSVVLCDLDGTIANITHRLHHVHKEPKDWKGFFAGIPSDTVNAGVHQMLERYVKDGRTVVFISARSEDNRAATVKWLDSRVSSVPYFTLIMRPHKDHRPDEQVKAEMLATYFPHQHVVHAVIDDRPRVIRMWREKGLQVVDVGQGIEF